MAGPDPVATVKAGLERLPRQFFRAVSFNAGESPEYDRIYSLFIERGLLIKNVGATLEILSVQEFIESRQAMFRSGELSSFLEEELSGVTQIFGNVAHRFSAYSKAGTMKGTSFAARGMVSTQCILTPGGWKMSAMAWDDERPGLSLPVV